MKFSCLIYRTPRNYVAVSLTAIHCYSPVRLHPVEVLGVGGDCQQRKERKGEGLSCHSGDFLCVYLR